MAKLRAGEVRFAVRLTPRAGSDRIDGVVDGALRCRVAAAPAEGAANVALLRLLARELGLPPSALRLVAGASARQKLVAVDAAAGARLTSRWPGLAGGANPGGSVRSSVARRRVPGDPDV